MINVILYNNSDDKRVVSKTLSAGTAATAELYDGTSILSPRLRMAWSSSYTSFNYMYISDFGRYYHITEIIADTGGAAIVTGAVDVLNTYRSQIGNLQAILVRHARKTQAGSRRSTWIEDSRLPIQAGRAVKAILFENSDLNIDTADMTSNNFVLNVAGGGAITP